MKIYLKMAYESVFYRILTMWITMLITVDNLLITFFAR